MLIKGFFLKHYLKLAKFSFSSSSVINSKKKRKKKGNIYMKSTSRNIFCTLMDVRNKKVKTSCTLKVPEYENEFNERVNPYKRGVLLGELFGDKIVDLGFREVSIHLNSGINKGRRGVLIGLSNKRIKISYIRVSKGHPHNGCRPSKIRRKKLRTKLKNW